MKFAVSASGAKSDDPEPTETDEKVSRDDRDTVPIVVSGGSVIWIAGYRGDERFRVTDSTRKVLKLELKRTL